MLKEKKTKVEFVQQQLYRETVEKIDELAKDSDHSKASIYERAVSRYYNSEKRRLKEKQVAA